MINTVAILGLGLMGSSLGLALKKRGYTGEIRAFARREETRARAIELGVADQVFADPVEAVKGADIIVVCVPIQTTPALVSQFLPAIKAGAIVTDVGSTKSALLDSMSAIMDGSNAYFVGSHPIAGSEKTGVDAGFADLYENRLTVISPMPNVPAAAIDTARALWEMTGSNVLQMDAAEHDAKMARTSHLPHLLASTLVRTIARGSSCADFCGTGFKDTTRVASGSPVVWRDIVATNCAPIIKEVEALKDELDGLIGLLKSQDSGRIETWLAEAADKRNTILNEGN